MSAPLTLDEQRVAKLQELAIFTSDVIGLMGLSFVLGVLFTTFILLVFDFMRRNHQDGE